jgi:hypothetical protein
MLAAKNTKARRISPDGLKRVTKLFVTQRKSVVTILSIYPFSLMAATLVLKSFRIKKPGPVRSAFSLHLRCGAVALRFGGAPRSILL